MVVSFKFARFALFRASVFAAAMGGLAGCAGSIGWGGANAAESSASVNFADDKSIAQNELDCAKAFETAAPLKTTPFPRGPRPSQWLYPARVEEVEGPLDLDGDGALERVFIGTYLPGQTKIDDDVSVLVIVSERGPLFRTINGDDLQAIFGGPTIKPVPPNSFPEIEKIYFHSFLNDINLIPDGKRRGENWLWRQYEDYFKRHKIPFGGVDSFPYLEETEVGIVSLKDEGSFLLLESRREFFRDETDDSWSNGEKSPRKFRFLARYLGEFNLEVICGEPSQQN